MKRTPKRIIALLLALQLVSCLQHDRVQQAGSTVGPLLLVPVKMLIFAIPAHADFDSDAPATTIHPPCAAAPSGCLPQSGDHARRFHWSFFVPPKQWDALSSSLAWFYLYGKQLLPVVLLLSLLVFSLMRIVKRAIATA